MEKEPLGMTWEQREAVSTFHYRIARIVGKHDPFLGKQIEDLARAYLTNDMVQVLKCERLIDRYLSENSSD